MSALSPRATSASSPLSPDEHAVIARVVDGAPPLTESTRARLAALLRPGVGQSDPFVDSLRNTIRGAA